MAENMWITRGDRRLAMCPFGNTCRGFASLWPDCAATPRFGHTLHRHKKL